MHDCHHSLMWDKFDEVWGDIMKTHQAQNISCNHNLFSAEMDPIIKNRMEKYFIHPPVGEIQITDWIYVWE